MENIPVLMKAFEERNNLSISVNLESDGHGMVVEFWRDECVFDFTDPSDLVKKLKSIDLELDEKGLCYSPVRILNQD